MSNILNLLSEETFIEKMDRQNELLEYLVKVQGGVGIIPNYTWEEIQRIVRLGIAPKIFELGGQLSVNRNGEELVFDIVSFDTAVPADTARSHSMTLMLHDLPWQFEFNTARSSSSDSYYGATYAYSTIRQWLNSSESAGNWWSSINNNTTPSYANIDGFMKGLDSDFLNVVGKTRINNRSIITDDYFFIPSLIEVNWNQSNAYNDGTTFGYYAASTSNDLRVKRNKEGKNIPYWTRTGSTSSGYNQSSVYYVNSSGVGNDFVSYNSTVSGTTPGVCPVCNII